MAIRRQSSLASSGKAGKQVHKGARQDLKAGALKHHFGSTSISLRNFTKPVSTSSVDDLIAAAGDDAIVTIKRVRAAKGRTNVRLSKREAAVLALVLKNMRARNAVAELSPEKVAELIAAAIPETGPSPWNELIGPFYSTASLALLRDVSRQALQKMRQAHKLLSATTSDHKILYPSFQFDAHREPR